MAVNEESTPKPTPWERSAERAVDAVPNNTPVWRYLSLYGLIDAIEKQRLRLTRVDKFRDAFEGSVTKQQMEQQETILLIAASQRQPSDEDPRALIKRLRQARIRSSHASCWSCGYESELLWRYYCADNNCPGVGVAFRTTLARLEASLEVHNLYVRAIKYLDYQEAPPFPGDMSPLFHKRHGFADERELRLLKFNEEHY